MFEDIRRVINNRKSMKDRQNICKRKEKRQTIIYKAYKKTKD